MNLITPFNLLYTVNCKLLNNTAFIVVFLLYVRALQYILRGSLHIQNHSESVGKNLRRAWGGYFDIIGNY